MRQVIGGPIDLDPATSPDNPTRADTFYTPAQDGLKMPWLGTSIFLNPPWSRTENVDMRAWLKRAKEVRQLSGLRPGFQMFICISAAMNANWFHDHLADMDLFFFPRGRIKYDSPDLIAENQAPGFDSVLCYYGSQLLKFKNVFQSQGLVTMRLA